MEIWLLTVAVGSGLVNIAWKEEEKNSTTVSICSSSGAFDCMIVSLGFTKSGRTFWCPIFKKT